MSGRLRVKLAHWLGRVRYRLWQFKQTLLPKLDSSAWQEAIAPLPPAVHPWLESLNKAEKAHVLRVWHAVGRESGCTEADKIELQRLALLHDIGKAVHRSSVFAKVLKVFLPISRNRHSIAGARLLKRLGFERNLVRRVLRHHQKNTDDQLLQLFQRLDDQQ